MVIAASKICHHDPAWAVPEPPRRVVFTSPPSQLRNDQLRHRRGGLEPPRASPLPSLRGQSIQAGRRRQASLGGGISRSNSGLVSIRRARHRRDSTASAIPAMFSHEPCFGAWRTSNFPAIRRARSGGNASYSEASWLQLSFLRASRTVSSEIESTTSDSPSWRRAATWSTPPAPAAVKSRPWQ